MLLRTAAHTKANMIRNSFHTLRFSKDICFVPGCGGKSRLLSDALAYGGQQKLAIEPCFHRIWIAPRTSPKPNSDFRRRNTSSICQRAL